jgi:iron complex outermembrane receptor protein
MHRKFSASRSAHPLACLLAAPFLWPAAADAEDGGAPAELPAIEVISNKTGKGGLDTTPESLYQAPAGQVQTTIPAERMENTQAFTLFDVLRDSPGVSLKQGNGPRDVGISIRGSNARNTFGIRNIIVFEDGFPVTQPDGLSRTDLTDAHAYGAIDVIRGPSSALYGNYATGGAINFRLRRGAEIQGLDAGTDAGSFGYLNNYLAYGSAGANYDISIFTSDVIGNGPTNHNLFNTQTVNALATYMPTPDDRVTVKGIFNRLYGDLSIRLNLDQFYFNPYQNNCYVFLNLAAARQAGCATVGIFRNGFFGPQSQLTAYQAGLHRDDTRSILGVRWEHNFGNAIARTQIVLDDKNIHQPTGATTAQGNEPAINIISDLTGTGTLFGFDATHFAGVYVNTESNTAYTFNVGPGGNGQAAGLTQLTPSQQTNAGIHGREEIRFTDFLSGVVGLGAEYTNINGTLNAFNYRGSLIPSVTSTPANNNYYNIAPEGALIYRPNSEWLVKARIATGYGTPQASNLFVTPEGTPGNNTQLKSQTNLGYDLAAIWTPFDSIRLSANGFYEFFRNELVSQSPGPSPLMTFTFNAPRSEHRGVEAAGEWLFCPGCRARVAYTYDNQIYTEYTEQLTGGAFTRRFDRAGHWIPGVPSNELTARIGYDVPAGPLAGFGGFAEYFLTDSFFADNANFLKIPGYRLVNLNIHYQAEFPNSSVQSVAAFFEVRNVFNNTYVASANNITNTLNPATGLQNPADVLAAGSGANSGTIYAGFPRTFVGGIRMRF